MILWNNIFTCFCVYIENKFEDKTIAYTQLDESILN